MSLKRSAMPPRVKPMLRSTAGRKKPRVKLDPDTGERLPNSGFPASVRAAIIERDRDCVVRGAWPRRCVGRLHAHHVWLKGQHGPNVIENGLALCTFHHDFAHKHVALARVFGVIVPSWAGGMILDGTHAEFRRRFMLDVSCGESLANAPWLQPDDRETAADDLASDLPDLAERLRKPWSY